MANTADDVPQNDLMFALSKLHIGGRYSDLTITCNSRKWAVHKAIVCSRSAFFDGATSGEFIESKTGVIDLTEDDEDAVEQMIHFFYHLDYLQEQTTSDPSALFRHRAYSDQRRKRVSRIDFSAIEDPLLSQAGVYAPQRPETPPKSATSAGSGHFDWNVKPRSPRQLAGTPPLEDDDEQLEDDEDEADDDDDDIELSTSTEAESHLLLHTRIYALAEKYDIPSLKYVAQRKFESAMACYYDAPEFADAVEEVYCSTVDFDRGLRDICLQAFRTHPQLVTTQDVYAVIQNTPTLALELFKLERGIPI